MAVSKQGTYGYTAASLKSKVSEIKEMGPTPFLDLLESRPTISMQDYQVRFREKFRENTYTFIGQAISVGFIAEEMSRASSISREFVELFL